MNALDSLKFFYPELILLGGAFLALILDFFVKNKKVIALFALAVLGASIYFCRYSGEIQELFFGFFRLDSLTHYFRYLALGIVAVVILLSMSYKSLNAYEGEYYSLFLFMALGLILMASSVNLLMIFLAIEFVSILSYLMVGFHKNNANSKESALKYLLFGSFSSGLMLFGMSLLFGASGSLNLGNIQEILYFQPFFPIILLASLLFLSGIAFKISMAPFHFWAPDVYEGAPTPVTAFLTVAPKAMGFALLMRAMLMIFPWFGVKWVIIISALAMITMTIGNVTAIAQHNIKRLLGFSSIAQAGYILMGLAAISETGLSAVLIYLTAYAFTNLGAFVAVIAVSNVTGNDDLASYKGLSKKSPFLAASLTIFLLSLAGIPPLAGFIGKFFVFSAAIEAGLLELAIVAAINSAVAGYYYFKIIRAMYLEPAESDVPVPSTVPLTIALCGMLAGTVLVGVFPSALISAVRAILFV